MANRKTLLKRRKTGTRLAVLFLDADEFKHINDSLGHTLGDRVLQLLGERVTSCVREGDTVARLGGDEFAVLLEEVGSADGVSTIAQKILDALSRPLRVESHEFVLTISTGISLFPDDGESAETLLKHADEAMYRAKQAGRANYQFYSGALERGTLAGMRKPMKTRQGVLMKATTAASPPTLGKPSDGALSTASSVRCGGTITTMPGRPRTNVRSATPAACAGKRAKNPVGSFRTCSVSHPS